MNASKNSNDSDALLWYAFICSDTGREYYYELRSGATTWVLPDGFCASVDERESDGHLSVHDGPARSSFIEKNKDDNDGCRRRNAPASFAILCIAVAGFACLLVYVTAPHLDQNNPLEHLRVDVFTSFNVEELQKDAVLMENIETEEMGENEEVEDLHTPDSEEMLIAESEAGVLANKYVRDSTEARDGDDARIRMDLLTNLPATSTDDGKVGKGINKSPEVFDSQTDTSTQMGYGFKESTPESEDMLLHVGEAGVLVDDYDGKSTEAREGDDARTRIRINRIDRFSTMAGSSTDVDSTILLTNLPATSTNDAKVGEGIKKSPEVFDSQTDAPTQTGYAFEESLSPEKSDVDILLPPFSHNDDIIPKNQMGSKPYDNVAVPKYFFVTFLRFISRRCRHKVLQKPRFDVEQLIPMMME